MPPQEPFDFTKNEDEPLTLKNVVYQALGAASTCWTDMMHAGIFDSERAAEISEKLIKWINDNQPHGPYLGMATTEDLLREIVARMEMRIERGDMKQESLAFFCNRALQNLDVSVLEHRTVDQH